ncbi:MAG: hypothetical protein M1838_003540 [Thelocarpon superellum]|nr:MAG: hypothetical protein M1838_003540 [Thelocarpon superellum]
MALLLLGLLSLTGLASLAEGSEVGPGSSSSSSSSSSSHTTEIHPRFNMPQSYLFCAAQLSSNPDDFPPGTDLAWYKGDLAKYCLTPPTSLGNAAPFGPGGLCLPYLPTLKFNQAQVPPNVMDLWMAHRTCAASLPCPRCECMWDQEKYEAERKAYEARVRWQQFQQDLGLTWNPAGAGARGQGRSSRPETLSQTEAMDTEMHRVCSVEQPGNEHSANPAANAAAEGTGTCSNHANPTGQAGQAGFVNMGTVAVGPTLPAAQAGQGQSQDGGVVVIIFSDGTFAPAILPLQTGD